MKRTVVTQALRAGSHVLRSSRPVTRWSLVSPGAVYVLRPAAA